jgi:hypothetical protein
MSIKTYWKIVNPRTPNASVTDSQDIGGNRGLYGNYTWYNRIIQGSTTRLVRYREYDVMDNDIDVARALDIIAEEMTGNNPKTRQPLEILIEAGAEERIPSHVVATLNSALRTWCTIHNWQGGRLFNIARNTIKYGDCFFERNKNKDKPNQYIHPKHVLGAAVGEDDLTDVRGWYVNSDYKKPNQYLGSGAAFQSNGGISDNDAKILPKEDVVRYSLFDDMDEEAPFGVSILRPMYKVFKQKELLEDSILIYRISRAPEKRVFFIDVGNRPDHLAQRQLEMFRNEIKQKKIPTRFGGTWQSESVYNPQSMNEDFYFAVRGDQKGSRVETLPGGQGLGELTELDYFYRKMFRGLRIPSSYLGTSTDDGQAIENEGRVGVAYIQEIKFAQYVNRLQRFIEDVMDQEFKRWLYESKIIIDPTIYRVALPEPSDYHKSRDMAMNGELLNNLSSAEGVPYFSKRFIQEKYGGLTKAEIKMNERLLREERGLDPNGDDRDLPLIYAPEEAEAGGFDGGIGGGGLGGGGMPPPPAGGDDLGDNLEGDAGAGTGAGGEATPADATGAAAGAAGAPGGAPPASAGPDRSPTR